VHDQLDRLGIAANSPIEQAHSRPWSTVLRVPTLEGAVYFKACADYLAHEAAVTQALALWRPDDVPQVLATDPERGWMLLADGGATLRSVIKADRDIGHWKRLLPQYAELQIDVADRLPDLLALGIPDRRPATLPRQYQKLLENQERLLIDQEGGLTATEYRRLLEMAPRVASLSQQLADSPIPESIHHGDFHDANIFLNDGHYVFFDWGDCSSAHPFFSLRTAFVSVWWSLELEEEAPEYRMLRDAYLEAWTRYAPLGDLRAAFGLAARLSPICSALGWNHGISDLDESAREEHERAVVSLLQEVLELEDSESDELCF
jgi:hypothetical protein